MLKKILFLIFHNKLIQFQIQDAQINFIIIILKIIKLLSLLLS